MKIFQNFPIWSATKFQSEGNAIDTPPPFAKIGKKQGGGVSVIKFFLKEFLNKNFQKFQISKKKGGGIHKGGVSARNFLHEKKFYVFSNFPVLVFVRSRSGSKSRFLDPVRTLLLMQWWYMIRSICILLSYKNTYTANHMVQKHVELMIK